MTIKILADSACDLTDEHYNELDIEMVPLTVHLNDDHTAMTVEFDDPARAVTPGQEVVLYDGEECLGSGTIDHAYQEGKLLQYV